MVFSTKSSQSNSSWVANPWGSLNSTNRLGFTVVRHSSLDILNLWVLPLTFAKASLLLLDSQDLQVMPLAFVEALLLFMDSQELWGGPLAMIGILAIFFCQLFLSLKNYLHYPLLHHLEREPLRWRPSEEPLLLMHWSQVFQPGLVPQTIHLLLEGVLHFHSYSGVRLKCYTST